MSARPSVLTFIGSGLLWAFLGAIVLPILAFTFVLIVNQFDSRCGTPGDSGGCEMGLLVAAAVAILPGAGIGLVIGLARAWLRARLMVPLGYLRSR